MEQKRIDKAFVVYHRMMEVMNEAEPTVKMVLLAYDSAEYDIKKYSEAILVSNMTVPKDVEDLLKAGLDSSIKRRTLYRTDRQ